ncbi:hypothetical protein QVD17_38997 [Tagetes erecta]|uniref:Uncharacterized protein n=1 Tax=Tagetes erecta TaxID=13708 RepID=A0AAD8JRI7_TARER|nr:hypothetical protein QVD17_38997 [Tagetes erecta]
MSHLLLYPYRGSGHIIPMLDLTHHLLRRGLTITIMVMADDIPLLNPLISLHPDYVHTFIYNEPKVTPSPHSSPFAKMNSTQKLFGPIVQWFHSHPLPPVAIVSDFLFGWTSELASHLGIRHVVFSPSGAFNFLIMCRLWRDVEEIKDNVREGDENFFLALQEIPNSPRFPWWQVPGLLRDYKTGDQDCESFRKGILANMTSWGIVFNSFEGLESVYLDHMKKFMGHDRVWAVGPLLPEEHGQIDVSGRGGSSVVPLDKLVTWLDQKPDESVVYICFGSKVVLSEKQMSALVGALELCNVGFILCLKESGSSSIPSGFEDRVGDRGFVVKGWVPQLAILRHRAVGSFVTHCGWNSTLEGITSGVMMLTWPMTSDQFANAVLLVDQLGIGKRVCEGGPEILPEPVELAQLLEESLSVDRPERLKIKKLSQTAAEAVKQGTSTVDLDAFINLVSKI